MSSDWTVRYKPDNKNMTNEHILIQNKTGNKIIIETKVSTLSKIDSNINDHYKHDLESNKISSAIKLIVPKYLIELTGTKLTNKILKNNDFEYVVYAPERYPSDGMIKGTLYDVALTAQVTMTPAKQIEEYISPLHDCMGAIKEVVQNLDNSAKTQIAQLLNQPKDVQTWRMAGLILSNAMVFYDIIADKITLEDGGKCKTFDELRNNTGSITQQDLKIAWKNVLDYNYNPIFSIAREILSTLKENESKEIIEKLYESSKNIRSKKVANASNMYGKLLQKVIVDRNKLASYYTRPEAAALMTKLVIPGINHSMYGSDSIKKYRIADFACGTGLLLSSAYRQLLFNYEASCIDKKTPANRLHKTLIEDCFVGLDVLPIATHLAVSSLAMMFPTEVFGKTKVKTMPIGLQNISPTYVKKKGSKRKIKKEIKHYRLGSLDLITNEISATLTHSIEIVKGKEINNKDNRPWSIEESHHLISDGSCDLIVMNPPFVRSTNHAGKHSKDSVPAFAAFGASDEDQKAMGIVTGKKFRNTCAHGNAGLASNFIAVCDKKIAKNGSMALIIPATISNGEAWNESRSLLKNGYAITVISIARPQITSSGRSFSSDTGMGEIILIAKKHPNIKTARGLFISIYERPSSILSAIQIGNSIHNIDGVDKMETGYGGTTLRIGSTQIGNMLDCPIEYNWPFVNVLDPLVEQFAYKIIHEVDFSHVFSKLNSCFEIGPHTLDITGNDLRGPFQRLPIQGNPKYIALWNNVQKQQTKMMVLPDIMLEPKNGATKEHITKIWHTASRTHININPDYTSNSLIVAYTDQVTVGGRTWPSVLMDKKYEKPFTVWCNSTFGILCFWSLTGKQQLGRGLTSRTAIKNLFIPDFTKMNKKYLALLSDLFIKYHNNKLDRIKNLWKDNVRISMDKEISKILGIKFDLEDIRTRLCMEPSISGGKPESLLIKKHTEIVRK